MHNSKYVLSMLSVIKDVYIEAQLIEMAYIRQLK